MAEEFEETKPKAQKTKPSGKRMAFAYPGATMIPMDGSAMLRPQRIWGWRLVVLCLLVVVATVIAFNMYTIAMDNVVYASEREEAQVNAQLSRSITLDLPAKDDFIGYSDDEIRANIANRGYVIFENEVSDGTTLEIVKVPGDMTLEQAQTLFGKGISKLSPVEAAQLLNGMWRLDVSRTNGTSIRLRYADFTSGSEEAALTSAMMDQGLTEDSVTDGGMDDSGNTYKTGTIDVNGVTATWRVSVLELSEMYSISSLPSTAMYVGIRYSY